MKNFIKRKALISWAVLGILNAAFLTNETLAQTPAQDQIVEKVLKKLQKHQGASLLLGQVVPSSPEDAKAVQQLWQNLSKEEQEAIQWVNPGITKVLDEKDGVLQSERMRTTSHTTLSSSPESSIQNNPSSMSAPEQDGDKCDCCGKPDKKQRESELSNDTIKNKDPHLEDIARIKKDLQDKLRCLSINEENRRERLRMIKDDNKESNSNNPKKYRELASKDEAENKRLIQERNQLWGEIFDNLDEMATIRGIENTEFVPLVELRRQAVIAEQKARELRTMDEDAMPVEQCDEIKANRFLSEQTLRNALKKYCKEQVLKADEDKSTQTPVSSNQAISNPNKNVGSGTTGSSGEGDSAVSPQEVKPSNHAAESKDAKVSGDKEKLDATNQVLGHDTDLNNETIGSGKYDGTGSQSDELQSINEGTRLESDGRELSGDNDKMKVDSIPQAPEMNFSGGGREANPVPAGDSVGGEASPAGSGVEPKEASEDKADHNSGAETQSQP